MFVGQGEWGAVNVYLYKFSGLVSWAMTLLNFAFPYFYTLKCFLFGSSTLTDLRER